MLHFMHKGWFLVKMLPPIKHRLDLQQTTFYIVALRKKMLIFSVNHLLTDDLHGISTIIPQN